MTCKDCEHYEACSFWIAMADISRMFQKGACCFFKDKSNMVEVVRCKDCKNYDHIHGKCASGLNGLGWEDFCSYGERKENGLLGEVESNQKISK